MKLPATIIQVGLQASVKVFFFLFLRVLEIELIYREEVLITNVACPNRFCFSNMMRWRFTKQTELRVINGTLRPVFCYWVSIRQGRSFWCQHKTIPRINQTDSIFFSLSTLKIGWSNSRHDDVKSMHCINIPSFSRWNDKVSLCRHRGGAKTVRHFVSRDNIFFLLRMICSSVSIDSIYQYSQDEIHTFRALSKKVG